MKALAKDELNALLQVARKHNELHYLLLLVTFNHGLRVSETLSLTGENIVNGFLVVQRLKGSKRTAQPLLPNEREGLLGLAASTTGLLFPNLSRFAVRRLIQKYGEEAGLPAFKCHPHVLKHTCGRLGFKGGMGIPEVQTYLGHVNGANTMIYMQADEEEAASAFAAAIGG